jgi:hypothetical protein
MKVSELACLLDSLLLGLEKIKGTAAATKDLRIFETALGFFSDRNIPEFVNFLQQCEEYSRTGVVSGKKPRAAAKKTTDPDQVPKAINAVRTMLTEMNQGLVDEQRIEATLIPFQSRGYTVEQLDQILAGLDLKGKAKSKKDAVEKIRQLLRTQLEAYHKIRLIQGGAGT